MVYNGMRLDLMSKARVDGNIGSVTLDLVQKVLLPRVKDAKKRVIEHTEQAQVHPKTKMMRKTAPGFRRKPAVALSHLNADETDE